MKIKRQERQGLSEEVRQESDGPELVCEIPHEWPKVLPHLDVDKIPIVHEDPWSKEIRKMLGKVTGKNKDIFGEL